VKSDHELNILFSEHVLGWKKEWVTHGVGVRWERKDGTRTLTQDFCGNEQLVGMVFNFLRMNMYTPVMSGNSYEVTCSFGDLALFMSELPGRAMVIAALERKGIDTGVRNDD